MIRRAQIAAAIGLAAALALPAHAQTATVTALTGQSCAGTRSGKNLGCTAHDFTTTATFTQPSATELASCLAGSTLSLNVVSTIISGSPTRYNGGVFFGEAGNDPSANNATATCSLAVFPLTPLPFQSLDSNSCGDFASSGTATLQVNAVSMKCLPAPGTNVLNLPYTLVFDNSAGNAASCNSAIITAATNSKCVSNSAAQVTKVDGTGVVVQGYIQITKQTVPAADPQSFAFTATAAASPASFSLAAGQSQTVQIPLSATGGNQTLQIDETALTGWVPTASIACTTPSGGSAAAYVTVDNANRRITATLNATNYGALCTITNTKNATVQLTANSLGGTGAFSFSGGTNGLPASLTLDTSTANPVSSAAYVVTANGAATSITQAIPAGWTLSASCTDGSSSFGTLAGGTLTIAAGNVIAGRSIVCTFTQTRDATLTKAFSPVSVPAGSASTLSFTLSNSTGNPAQAALGFTDTFPSNLTVASPLAVTNTCGGSLYRGGTTTALAAGDPSIALSGGALASGVASCTVSVAVVSSVVGSYTNGAAQITGVTGGLQSGVTSQVLTVYLLPQIALAHTVDSPTKQPGAIVVYGVQATNTGSGPASSVVLSERVGRYTSFSLNAFGAGVPFQLTDGVPSSGLSLGTPAYSSDGGATYTYTPVSGGGGAPAGYDANVTHWRIPMTGTMPAGGTCSLSFKAIVN